MIIVNFKAYSEASGENAVEIAEACQRAAEETGERLVIAPQPQDLLRLEGSVETFAQHVDPVDPGSHTGHLLASGIKEAGASGTLLNHSEKRLEDETIRRSIEKARENGLTTVVCAQDPGECEKYSRMEPDFIAYEPPELIGGDVSVSEAHPELIGKAVERSRVPALTGAGIHSRADVEKSIELGTRGVLVASGIVKSGDPYSAVKEMCQGL